MFTKQCEITIELLKVFHYHCVAFILEKISLHPDCYYFFLSNPFPSTFLPSFQNFKLFNSVFELRSGRGQFKAVS